MPELDRGPPARLVILPFISPLSQGLAKNLLKLKAEAESLKTPGPAMGCEAAGSQLYLAR
jgi:hypothetical protein